MADFGFDEINYFPEDYQEPNPLDVYVVNLEKYANILSETNEKN